MKSTPGEEQRGKKTAKNSFKKKMNRKTGVEVFSLDTFVDLIIQTKKNGESYFSAKNSSIESKSIFNNTSSSNSKKCATTGHISATKQNVGDSNTVHTSKIQNNESTPFDTECDEQYMAPLKIVEENPEGFGEIVVIPETLLALENLTKVIEQAKAPEWNWVSGGGKIGSGRFGKVFKAELETGDRIVVKDIVIDLTEKDCILRQLVNSTAREIEVMGELDHRNIVRFLGASYAQKGKVVHVYIVMESDNGVDLRSIYKKNGFGRLPEDQVQRFTKHVLEALKYIHSKGIVHRDVKAANIIFSRSQNVAKLGDFGSTATTLSDRLKNEGEKIVVAPAPGGTWFWMDPELFRGGQKVGLGPHNDIWSLGCTILELLTGKLPWDWDGQYRTFEEELNGGATFQGFMYRVVTERRTPGIPTTPDVISRDLADFLKLCFCLDPKKRPSADQLLRHPWVVTTSSSAGLDDEISHFVKVPQEVEVIEEDENEMTEYCSYMSSSSSSRSCSSQEYCSYSSDDFDGGLPLLSSTSSVASSTTTTGGGD